MINKLAPEDITFRYQALDVVGLTLDILRDIYLCEMSQQAVDKVFDEYNSILEGCKGFSKCVNLVPISIFSLTEACVEMLSHNKLPSDILEYPEAHARNLIYHEIASDFLDHLVNGIFTAPQFKHPSVSTWATQCMHQMKTARQETVASNPELAEAASVINKGGMVLDLLIEKFPDGYKKSRAILSCLLREEAIGSLSQMFVHDQLMQLGKVMDAVEPSDKDLTDQLFKNIPGGVHFSEN